jgi:hypothetical protein
MYLMPDCRLKISLHPDIFATGLFPEFGRKRLNLGSIPALPGGTEKNQEKTVRRAGVLASIQSRHHPNKNLQIYGCANPFDASCEV